MNREDARTIVNNNLLTDYIALEESKGSGMYCCPVCGSGTGKNKTGALKIYSNEKRVKCFSGNCFSDKGEDTLGALKIIWRCSENEVFERLNLNNNTQPLRVHTPQKKDVTPDKIYLDQTEFYKECHEALKTSKEAQTYLLNRGITAESIKRFNIGYCENWKIKEDSKYTSKRIIIPRSNISYLARSIEGAEPQKAICGKQKDIFNLKVLEDDPKVIFVCEGEIDAISLTQCGVNAVGVGGANSNINTFTEAAKKHPETIYILMLDNDETGIEAQKKLFGLMLDNNLIVYSTTGEKLIKALNGCKDANEAYLKDKEAFETIIKNIEQKSITASAEKLQEIHEKRTEQTGGGMVNSFFKAIQTEKYKPMPTGIYALDNMLQGGIMKGNIIMLMAAPGMGKTCFSQWIFENMAQNGTDVLYLNMEMARDQLLARSISRICHEELERDYSTMTILKGYNWTDIQRRDIEKAVNAYSERIAPRMVYNPQNGIEATRGGIMYAIEAETARIEGEGRNAPVICIDYLQLVQSENGEDAADTIKKLLKDLKDFSIKHNTSVFCIVASNRAANTTGNIKLESGRDTSALEYTGDLVLGLNYTCLELKKENSNGTLYTLEEIRSIQKRYKEEYKRTGIRQKLPKECCELSLVTLKNRFGYTGDYINLYFNGEFSSFRVVE